MSIIAKIREEPTFFLVRKMWQFAEEHRGWIVAFLSMTAVANLVSLAQPLVFGAFLNELQNNGLGEHNISKLIFFLFGLLGVELAFWLFHGPSRIIEKTMAFRTARVNYRNYLLSGVFGLGLSWHALRESGDTIDKVNKATEGLYSFSRNSHTVVSVVIKAVGTTVVLFFFNWAISLIAFVLLVMALFVIFRFDMRLIPHYKKLNVFDNRIAARIFDCISNITTVKVLHIEAPVTEAIRRSFWTPFPLFRQTMVLMEAKWFVGSFLFNLLIIVPLAVYLLFLYKNNLPVAVGTISALYLYLARLIEVYHIFAGEYEDMIVNKTRVLNVVEIEKAFLAQKKVRQRKIPRWRIARVENLSFAYEDADDGTRHLRNINFGFTRGEHVALIGGSGSGKTTFLKVLHGMYPFARAEMRFGKRKKTQQTNFADLDLKTTLVPQEPEVFSASIRENITLGLNYVDKEIFAATDAAEFTSVLHGLPRGLESGINEKGVNLSGGQKQRLALARALLFAEGKEVILFDESTSSVDPETETKIYRNIFDRFTGKTILASVHKMNLLKHFDRIVMFAGGEIVDEGTFDDLLTRNEQFRKEWEKYITRQKTP